MQFEDNAEAVRRLAYEIWEREGRPSGREHEHWAEANRLYEPQHPQRPMASVVELPRWDRRKAERQEAQSLRRALYTPEPFSAELYGRTG